MAFSRSDGPVLFRFAEASGYATTIVIVEAKIAHRARSVPSFGPVVHQLVQRLEGFGVIFSYVGRIHSSAASRAIVHRLPLMLNGAASISMTHRLFPLSAYVEVHCGIKSTLPTKIKMTSLTIGGRRHFQEVKGGEQWKSTTPIVVAVQVRGGGLQIKNVTNVVSPMEYI